MIRRFWTWFTTPAARWGWGILVLAGGLGGVIFWGGFNTYMEYTNTLGFCISCHEMRDNAYAEYRESVHFKNASGVRVVCADCHVPRDWTAKLLRKIRASNELYHKAIGTISTPEKYEAQRLAMAERVWASMMASDSRECRNCHSYEAMDFHAQARRAAEKMQAGRDEGKTCIECHKGVAHKLPKDYDPDGD